MKLTSIFTKALSILFLFCNTFISKVSAQDHYKLVVDSNGYYPGVNFLTTKDNGIAFLIYKNDFLFVKLDSLFNVTWSKKIYISGDRGDIFQDSIGNYYIPGWAFGPLDDETFIINKLDTAGNRIDKIAGIDNPVDEDAEYRSVKFDSINNHILIVYEYDDSQGWQDNFLVTDLDFNILWSMSYYNGFMDVFPMYGYNGEVHYMLTDLYGNGLVKIDTGGNVQWRKRLINGGNIISGFQKDSAYYFTCLRGFQSLLVKTDLNGTVLNATCTQLADTFIFNKTIMDNNSKLIVQANGREEQYILQFDDSLNLIQSWGDSSLYEYQIKEIDTANNVLLGVIEYNSITSSDGKTIIEKMNYINSCSFYPATLTMQPASVYDSTLTLPAYFPALPFDHPGANQPGINVAISPYFECIATGIKEAENNTTVVNLYPNPVIQQSNISISSSYPVTISNIEIVNAMGSTIYQQKIKSRERIDVTLPNLVSGIFFVKIDTTKGQVVKKMIVQ